MKKAPNDIDRQVGGRVRTRRLMIGMSQEKLGEALGLTFQQVQKYEKGTNRISASRLHQIAKVLEVTVEYLYGGSGTRPGFAEGEAAPYEADLITADGLKLLKAFNAITEAKVRRRVLDLVQALSAGSSDG
jgi:transcriptional regulator with XRE-family HTH domain